MWRSQTKNNIFLQKSLRSLSCFQRDLFCLLGMARKGCQKVHHEAQKSLAVNFLRLKDQLPKGK